MISLVDFRIAVLGAILSIVVASCAAVSVADHVAKDVPISVSRVCGNDQLTDGWAPIQIVSAVKYHEDFPSKFLAFESANGSKLAIAGLPNQCAVILASNVGPISMKLPNVLHVLNDTTTPFHRMIWSIEENFHSECQAARRTELGSDRILNKDGTSKSQVELFREQIFCSNRMDGATFAVDLSTPNSLFRMYIFEDELFLWTAIE